MNPIRSLVIANCLPYPPRSGSPLRVWQHINVLATRGPVYVFSIGAPRRGPGEMPIAAGWTHIDDAAFPRRNGLGMKIAGAIVPRQYPVPDTFASRAINHELRAVINAFRPDLVVLSHWKNKCPAPLRRRRDVIFDMHNIESLLATDGRTIRPRILRAAILWRSRRHERAIARFARRVWVCGQNDATLLRKLDRRLTRPIVVPNAVDVERYAPVRSHEVAPPPGLADGRPTIVYTGLYSYAPNAAAARELIDTIFPAVRRRVPAARLLLVGADPTPEMCEAAARDAAIVVTGAVERVEPYLGIATISVVPLREGGGTRLKILECFAARIAVVSTTKGAEGITAIADRDIAVSDDPQTLADLAIGLLLHDERRQAQADAAFRIVNETYSWCALSRSLDERIVGVPGLLPLAYGSPALA